MNKLTAYICNDKSCKCHSIAGLDSLSRHCPACHQRYLWDEEFPEVPCADCYEGPAECYEDSK